MEVYPGRLVDELAEDTRVGIHLEQGDGVAIAIGEHVQRAVVGREADRRDGSRIGGEGGDLLPFRFLVGTIENAARAVRFKRRANSHDTRVVGEVSAFAPRGGNDAGTRGGELLA